MSKILFQFALGVLLVAARIPRALCAVETDLRSLTSARLCGSLFALGFFSGLL